MLNLAANTPSGSYLINNSLRFRRSAGASLDRTTGYFGQSTWVFSVWVKKARNGSDMRLLYVDTSNFIGFNTSDNIVVQGAGSALITTTAVYRDPSAWYHILVKRTSSNYTLYVNGVLIATSGSSSGTIGDGLTAHYIGGQSGGSNSFDGYMAELNWAGGTSPVYTDFGAINADTGVWSPKRYTGSYGTTIGSYLNFSDNSALTTSSNVGLGKDFSGNGNYWTTNNISITSGATYDSMTDVPTLAGATASNFSVINPLYVTASTQTPITNGNLTANNSGAISSGCVTVMPLDNGKWYWEVNVETLGATMQIGVIPTGMTTSLGKTSTGIYAYHSGGTKYVNGVSSAYGSSYTAGDTIGMTYDSSTGILTAYKNNTSQGTLTTLTTTTSYTPYLGFDNGGAQLAHINFGQRPFTYTPPTGYVALNTYNLATPTLGATASTLANKYMDATTYTGTGASLSVTNSGSFKPDFVWIKGRSGATDHALYDSVRGTTKDLVSNSTSAETTEAQGLTTFGTSGFTVGTLAKLNTSSATYVGWQWIASNTTAVTNTDGSITSSVSANTSAGFSIVSFTGTAANATVGHGLGVAPKMIIEKCRSSGLAADIWNVYHTSTGAGNYLRLNGTQASTAGTTWWNNTAPTSSVFSIGTENSVNKSGQTYIAYCWAEIDGFSKFGSYTGNGSTDGPFVYTGFRPKYIMIKRTDSTDSWRLYDSVRDGGYNGGLAILYAELSQAEDTGAAQIDFLSNGFKTRSATWANQSGGTFIYMAFADNPFKYSLAR